MPLQERCGTWPSTSIFGDGSHGESSPTDGSVSSSPGCGGVGNIVHMCMDVACVVVYMFIIRVAIGAVHACASRVTEATIVD